MPNRLAHAAVLLAFSTLTALAAASDPPARVGRVALAQGQVTIGSDIGAEMMAAQVNWPVTSGNTISTAAGSRTELRVGSTSIRLDGDSSLEVQQLDDDAIRLRLHYGSASVRVLNADVLAGFVLETPQARVRLQQPGRVRVDAERVRDTSAVTVFDGTALVEDGGSQLVVRAGRRAELGDDDIRTLAAVRDAFDDWALTRDRYGDNATSARYVTQEMTGYEDLDRYGSWRDDTEYGPLWTPAVASTWVPYRDGSWTWVEPWGWTWVDNAPWGYAPFHYGRWVRVHNRWAWAPGRRHDHLVWAPALVGWVGGPGFNLAFGDRRRPLPATGWYPLTPHDRFVPTWRAPDNHQRWLNEHVYDDRRHQRDYRPLGLTVLPQDRFGQPGRVHVPRTPITTAPPTLLQNVQAGAPPAPPPRPNLPNRPGRDERPDWYARRIESERLAREGMVRARQPAASIATSPVAQAQGQPVMSPTPHMSAQPLSTVTSPTPHLPPQPLSTVTSPTPRPSSQMLTTDGPVFQAPQNVPPADVERWRRERAERVDRIERRGPPDEWRRNRPQAQPSQPQPIQSTLPVQSVQPVQALQPMRPQPAPVVAAPPQVERQQPRFDRPEPRVERTETRIERPSGSLAQAVAPRPAPPVERPAPPPAPVAAPRPAPAPAPAAAPARPAEERRAHPEERNRRQQDR